jgi:hypothetical protein
VKRNFLQIIENIERVTGIEPVLVAWKIAPTLKTKDNGV